jgi:chemotaxis protein methyltransferase CheR
VNEALVQVARMIERESGMVLKPAQLPALEDAIARVDRSLTPTQLLADSATPELIQRLIDEVTIRETYFFRHRAELDAIDWHGLLAACRGRGAEAVRVWVAGCASGEEAYTVAMLACEAFASASPPVQILGTDIATAAIEQAVAGCYRTRAVRRVNGELERRYFEPQDDGSVRVGSRLRSLVTFSRHNLVRDPIPPPGAAPFDVVLCRNVLIYFERATVERVTLALERALTPSGMLVLGAADRLSGPAHAARAQGLGPSAAVTGTRPRRSPQRRSGAAAHATGARRGGGEPASVPARTTSRAQAPKGTGARRATASNAPEPTPTLEAALAAADRNQLDDAIAMAERLLDENPLDSEAHYVRGVAQLARGDAHAALDPLRRALYIEPNFSLAAFNLARAHDALKESEQARRAYERTLRTLDHTADAATSAAVRFDAADIFAACHARLKSLAGAS